MDDQKESEETMAEQFREMAEVTWNGKSAKEYFEELVLALRDLPPCDCGCLATITPEELAAREKEFARYKNRTSFRKLPEVNDGPERSD